MDELQRFKFFHEKMFSYTAWGKTNLNVLKELARNSPDKHKWFKTYNAYLLNILAKRINDWPTPFQNNQIIFLS